MFNYLFKQYSQFTPLRPPCGKVPGLESNPGTGDQRARDARIELKKKKLHYVGVIDEVRYVRKDSTDGAAHC